MRAAALALAAMLAAPPAWAVFSGDMSPRAESGDADYAEAIRMRDAKDWFATIDALKRVVARRPWHDNAHSLLGYSYRQIEEYELSLHHYHIALELNPRHRQALEYLGRAYLQMHWPDKARETLARLGEVCTQVSLTFSDGDFTDGCDEYRMLRDAVVEYERTGEAPGEDG